MAAERIHRATSLDGTQIVGRVHGQGPPLVLLHARLDDGDSGWGALLPLIAGRFTCYLPSTRGRGLSADHPDHAPERLVEDATAFIDSLGEPVCVAGLSLGAGLALGAAARSAAVAAVAAYEPEVPAVVSEAEAARLRDGVARAVELAEQGRPVDAARAFIEVVANDEEVAATTQYLEAWGRNIPAALHERRQLAQSASPPPTDQSELAKITVPVLLLCGSHSALPALSRGARHVASYLADARVVEIAGSGHLGPVVQPETVAAELTRFFATVATTGLTSGSRPDSVRPDHRPTTEQKGSAP